MESENNNFFKTNLAQEDVNLPAFRIRYKKLALIFFKLFFITLTLIIGALIIYLVQDIASDSDQSIPHNPGDQTFDPIITTKSQIFDTLFLQRAADELEDVTSLILSNYSGSNIDNNTEFALKKCLISLQNGSGKIRDALEANSVSETLSDEQRVEVMNRMFKAEDNIKSCLDHLEKVESTAVSEVRAKVHRTKVYLSGRGDFLMNYDENIWHKFSNVIAAAWDMVCLFIVCLGGLQLLFIFYLLLASSKFR